MLRNLHLPVILGSIINYAVGISCFLYHLRADIVPTSLHIETGILGPLGRGMLLLWLAGQVTERGALFRLLNVVVIMQGVYHLATAVITSSITANLLEGVLVLEILLPLLLLGWHYARQSRLAEGQAMITKT
ncbi:MAG: hypothetical protein AAFU54_14930 [Chloroflexota bacterium]